ncbi:MAG TPA: ATP-binding protein [Solirubrobacterales bacterium]
MRRAARLGLRARLAISIGAIVTIAFAVVFVAVKAQMSHESNVIRREEAKEAQPSGAAPGESRDSSTISPIEDAHTDVERTLVLVGAATLVAALFAGYLVAARAASPMRRFAATAARIDAGDLTPRLEAGPGDAEELRTLAEAFNHMLDRLDDAFARQRQFVSDASHELRSPLTAIRGQLEVLARERSPGEEEIRRVERSVMTEMRRVERLVDDLLALARLDEGVGPSLADVDAAPFLRTLLERAPGPVEAGPLAEGTLRIDPDLVAQVVRNLLANARQHAGTGGRVALSSHEDGPDLLVAVEDDGPGIPPDERERVFDRFHRSEPARERATGGAGLGLGISRSIVDAHRGRIWIEDSPIGGARVVFSLPGFSPSVRDLSANA